MITVSRTAHFEEPPAKVFDFLCDLTREPEWNPDVKSIERLDDGPIATGMKARGTYRGLGTMHIEATELRRPDYARFKTTGSKMDMNVTFRFSEVAGGTKFEINAEMEPKGAMKFLEPLIKSQVSKVFDARPDQIRLGLKNYSWDGTGG